jgi:dihydrofolate reductase
MVSMDGFHATPDGDLDWHTVNPEFHRFAVAQLDRADVLVFGRVTYTAMAQFWTSPMAEEVDHETAVRMKRLRKVVCSRTLEEAPWAPSSIIRDDVVGALARLKGETDGDLLILGSASLIATLTEAGVLDELRLMIAPVALGQGRPALEALSRRITFDLGDVRRFESGNLFLTYRPVGAK